MDLNEFKQLSPEAQKEEYLRIKKAKKDHSDLMITRCEEDVKINTLLWKRVWKRLLVLYETEEEVWKFLDYLSFKMDCAREQERSGWKLDTERCRTALDELETHKAGVVAQLI